MPEEIKPVSRLFKIVAGTLCVVAFAGIIIFGIGMVIKAFAVDQWFPGMM